MSRQSDHALIADHIAPDGVWARSAASSLGVHDDMDGFVGELLLEWDDNQVLAERERCVGAARTHSRRSTARSPRATLPRGGGCPGGAGGVVPRERTVR